MRVKIEVDTDATAEARGLGHSDQLLHLGEVRHRGDARVVPPAEIRHRLVEVLAPNRRASRGLPSVKVVVASVIDTSSCKIIGQISMERRHHSSGIILHPFCIFNTKR